jgi:hypothetical protein
MIERHILERQLIERQNMERRTKRGARNLTASVGSLPVRRSRDPQPPPARYVRRKHLSRGGETSYERGSPVGILMSEVAL